MGINGPENRAGIKSPGVRFLYPLPFGEVASLVWQHPAKVPGAMLRKFESPLLRNGRVAQSVKSVGLRSRRTVVKIHPRSPFHSGFV
jgi:hypothetical protein